MSVEIPLLLHGRCTVVKMFVTYYAYNGSLAISLFNKDNGEPEASLTVCLDEAPGLNRAYIDVNNLSRDIISQLTANGLGKPTGRTRKSGYTAYPEFEFDGELLKECDSSGYQEYLEWFSSLQEDEEYLHAYCQKCHEGFTFIVKKAAAEKYWKYLKGAPYLIQEIFPDMPPEERGLFTIGQNMCASCYKKCLDEL